MPDFIKSLRHIQKNAPRFKIWETLYKYYGQQTEIDLQLENQIDELFEVCAFQDIQTEN